MHKVVARTGPDPATRSEPTDPNGPPPARGRGPRGRAPAPVRFPIQVRPPVRIPFPNPSPSPSLPSPGPRRYNQANQIPLAFLLLLHPVSDSKRRVPAESPNPDLPPRAGPCFPPPRPRPPPPPPPPASAAAVASAPRAASVVVGAAAER
ncbi:hypothetical protein ZWY2020_030673 [Hordeum vulgare]|nr:hypothetical protein ZWY2020_030673 [Hordeum vulgare]